ncbi:MAG: serine hydrolase domain-containing protein [Planctomycetota bacterium]|jgi:CubicO group peptidase (beta-lactamase class C family)
MTMRTSRTIRIAAAAALALAAFSSVARAGADAPTLQDRLDRMVEQLEESRVKYHIPGMAIAVVKDDEVILSRGFGLANVEDNVPATDETLFAVGSTTKAFTAALVGMLVDDGHMGWDDPVRNHLAGYALADPEANEKVVMRDLLCHRIGLASMTLLWYGNDVGREEVIETAAKAELLHPFRKQFNYSNVSYLAAGMAAGAAGGSDWDTLMARRLLGPLGMTSSNTSYEAAQADSRMAKGYKWEKDECALTHQPMRNVNTVGPAGSINSSVQDMAQWVRFQLGRGVYDGRQLLSPQQHEQTWSKHVTIGGDVDYGLGWFLRERHGQRVIEHAGGIDGFTAEVAMIPEENLGFVLLMNLFASPLQEGSREIVFKTMLEDWSDDDALVAEEDLEPFLGTYIGNFGQFKDAEFKVVEQDGRLAVDVPGQMVFELAPPDDEGKRQFVITDQVSVKFNREDQGKAHSFVFYQAGYEFEVPRKGMEMPVEFDLDAARPYLGVYHFDKVNADVRVLIQNNRLAIDVPGQMVFELHPPDGEDRWVFRIKDSLWVRFNRDDADAVTSLTWSEEGSESLVPRLDDPETVALPSVDEVMAMVHDACGADRLASLRNYLATGTVRMVHVGVKGKITSVVEADGRFRDDMDLGKFGHIRLQVNDDDVRIDAPFMPDTDLGGEFFEQAALQHPLLWLGDWRETFTEIHVREKLERDGEPVYAISLKPPLGPASTLFVGAETGLPVAREASNLSAVGMRVPMTYEFGEYREVMGVMIPHRVALQNPISGRVVVHYETFEPNVETEKRAHGSNPRDAAACCPQPGNRLLKAIVAAARAVH